MKVSCPVTLADSAVHIVRTPLVPEALRLDVAVPFGYHNTTECYPVVYLIDSHWFFPIVSQMARLMAMDGEMPPVIVVGVGYDLAGLTGPKLEQRVSSLRYRDLTPVVDPGDWWSRASIDAPDADIPHGQAGVYLRVIEESVKPLIRSNYRTLTDETLAGFSLGALFTLTVMFQRTHSFARYIAGSPALWWGEGALFALEAEYARAHRDLPKRLFLSVGESEERAPYASFRMVSNLKHLASQLAERNFPSLRCTSQVQPGETHSTAVAATFVHGLKAIFRPDPDPGP